ncbi:MAG: PIN domain-containing protein [Bifidobacteriaceae bacterium]|jgi:predicted nucleic acid-binding protein|nr:PIN domain-containing protein [Bifidobacteriaceae bacterium]
MVVVDTSALLAFLDAKDVSHGRVAAALAQAPRPLIVSALAVAELDYLVLSRYGVAAELAVLEALSSPAWRIIWLDQAEYRAALGLVRTYADQRIGLTDASALILARRYQTNVVATLDRRHFSAVRLPTGEAVRIIPE